MNTLEKDRRALRLLRKALKRAMQKMDPVMVGLLAEVRDELRSIETIQTLALRGEYVEPEQLRIDGVDEDDMDDNWLDGIDVSELGPPPRKGK
jgi:hypothetical protein